MNRILVVFPPGKIISNWVRFECIEPHLKKHQFLKFNSDYKNEFHGSRIVRFVNNNFLRFLKIVCYAITHNIKIIYWVKPTSWKFLLILRTLGFKNVIDINDPYHLSEFIGKKNFRLLLRFSDHCIFESIEYLAFCNGLFAVPPSSVIEDSCQREVILPTNPRNRSVVWVGSPVTSEILLRNLNYLKLFVSFGYSVALWGVSEAVVKALRSSGLVFEYKNQYSFEQLQFVLGQTLFSFIPADEREITQLRGNLKAKISMSFGAIPIAKRIPMHSRLIDDSVDGFTYENISDLREKLERNSDYLKMSEKAFKKIQERHLPIRHATQLDLVFDDFINQNK